MRKRVDAARRLLAAAGATLRRLDRTSLIRLLATGALAALPVAATLAIFVWLATVLLGWVGPDSLIGRLLVAIGLGSEFVGYLLGLGLLLAALVALGALVEAGLERGLARLVDGVMRRIPLVRQVYELVQRLVALFGQRDPNAARAMQAVWVRFGGKNAGEGGGAVVLALQTAAEVLEVDGRRCVAVLVPTAPVPIGGGLLFVPEDWVTHADLSVEAVTSLYVSMGVTAPQHLRLADPVPPAVSVAP